MRSRIIIIRFNKIKETNFLRNNKMVVPLKVIIRKPSFKMEKTFKTEINLSDEVSKSFFIKNAHL